MGFSLQRVPLLQSTAWGARSLQELLLVGVSGYGSGTLEHSLSRDGARA